MRTIIDVIAEVARRLYWVDALLAAVVFMQAATLAALAVMLRRVGRK